jgi:1-deoxy-D-xylulose-5-phosphate synthase
LRRIIFIKTILTRSSDKLEANTISGLTAKKFMNKILTRNKNTQENITSSKNLLETIDSPADLRKIPRDSLPYLAAEIRRLMIDVVSANGGHLAPSLGTVELTLALHYCYNTPEDKLVWDVGHQAYTHKIITGRRERFTTLRQFGGISGFPRPTESEYDVFTTGHASTSISTALGLAIARDILKEKHSIIACIGDGSLSNGLAFEGLNNLGMHKETAMTVVLNDNEMSIAKNVGAMSKYLTRLITDTRYDKVKRDVWELLGRIAGVGKKIQSLMRDVDDTLKHFVIPGKLFEDMGLRYFGPVDGHNINEMIEVFRFVKEHSTGPVLVHVLTKKGKGYSFAEENATKYHGIGRFSIDTGAITKSKTQTPSYSDIFGSYLTELGKKNREIVAISAAMPDGTGLARFRDEFPDRFFDVGIAEGHAVAFAAGLSARGLTPVIAIYSTFLQRAYDQIFHDIALDKRHVVFCLDRAGLVGEDGPTHHGVFDLSYLRHIPGLTIMAPSNEIEMKSMMLTAILHEKGPVFIRYPRGSVPEAKNDNSPRRFESYEPRTISTGKRYAIVSLGEMTAVAEKVTAILKEKGIEVTLVDARFCKPLDDKFYGQLFDDNRYIITMESNVIAGGFGSAVAELAQRLGKSVRMLNIGFPDEFIPHGPTGKLFEELSLTPKAIAIQAQDFFSA